jgi:phage terminase large subunit-like protein
MSDQVPASAGIVVVGAEAVVEGRTLVVDDEEPLVELPHAVAKNVTAPRSSTTARFFFIVTHSRLGPHG